MALAFLMRDGNLKVLAMEIHEMRVTICGQKGTCTDPHVFKGICMISGYSLEMKGSVVYKLDRPTLPSIEAHALVETELLLLESTVSATHSWARFKHVSAIIALADQTSIQRVNIRMIYIVLSSVLEFNLPQCVVFCQGKTVELATVDDSEFCHHLRRVSGAQVKKGQVRKHSSVQVMNPQEEQCWFQSRNEEESCWCRTMHIFMQAFRC
jgi:hypothetical protein